MLVLHLRGVDFNMMVVAGLLVAIAAVVDDAIVDADNIRRRLRETRDGTARPIWRIIADASLEMRGPMLYATLIIVIAVAAGAPDAGAVGRVLSSRWSGPTSSPWWLPAGCD